MSHYRPIPPAHAAVLLLLRRQHREAVARSRRFAIRSDMAQACRWLTEAARVRRELQRARAIFRACPTSYTPTRETI